MVKGSGFFAHGKTLHEAHAALQAKILKCKPIKERIADHTAMTNLWKLSCEDTKLFNYFIASAAVELADALVINLKKGNKHDGEKYKIDNYGGYEKTNS